MGNTAKIQDIDMTHLPELYRDVEKTITEFGKLKTTTPEQSDQITRVWLAAQKSPIAALGFDPHHIISSQRRGLSATIGGFYAGGDEDKAWFDRNSEESAVHESLHRGVEMLRKDGSLKIYKDQEEIIVRALMMKHFPNVEIAVDPQSARFKQIERAKTIDPKELDRFEAVAAKLIAKRHPGGPR